MPEPLACLSPRSVKERFAARGVTPARRILLAEDDAPSLVRFLSTPIELGEGTRASWVTVTRTGTFSDPRYGQFEITPAMLAQMVANFDKRVLGQDVFIDVSHRPSDGAAAKVVRLAIEGTRLRALVEWTSFGIEAVRERGFSYLSAEYHENWRDNEKGDAHGCVLLGAGLTTRPVIKQLEPVLLSTDDTDSAPAKLAISPQLLKALEHPDMNPHIKTLRDRLVKLGLAESVITTILAAAEKQLATAGTDEAKCLAVVETFAAAGSAAADQIKALAAAGNAGPVTLSLNVAAPTATGLDAAAVGTEVARLLAEREAAATTAATTLAAKVKLLEDAVAAAAGLSDEVRTTLLAEVRPLITASFSDEQVKNLATVMLSQASKASAAGLLATMGYRPASGSVHISVDSSNGIKALQQQVDKRLGFEGMSDAKRYERTGGKLLDANKALAERALEQFDALNGPRLMQEHKALAAGTGSVSDVAVPSVFERTVLRESLYQLLGLSFVDSGTAPLATTIQVPYAYRDTTAAGLAAVRTYENQGIQRAGIIQTYDEARPIPQKLAFKLSNEMKYLVQAAPIDFDPLADNIRNVIRIVGEDTDALIHNEILRATDEASVATANDTLTAQVNGTNRIFVLTQFPVVRPRQVFDLKGTQVGTTSNPITVTLGGVARSEYRTGVTLAAGTYYIMDYNLGELRFVNELGVLQTPANATALVVAYSWTQNVAKVNLDVQANPDTVADVYDRLLTQIGARKVVVENDRYYMANLLLMSGAVDNALGQAKTFQANSSRPGTGLQADGSVGVVKGIPSFNTRAPALAMADTRILVGERANTRFRMLRPISMTTPQEARDSNGLFTASSEGYGEQFVAVHTPTLRKNANTSLVLYSSTGRVARAS
jgi:hypothetical protein